MLDLKLSDQNGEVGEKSYNLKMFIQICDYRNFEPRFFISSFAIYAFLILYKIQDLLTYLLIQMSVNRKIVFKISPIAHTYCPKGHRQHFRTSMNLNVIQKMYPKKLPPIRLFWTRYKSAWQRKLLPSSQHLLPLRMSENEQLLMIIFHGRPRMISFLQTSIYD